MKQSTVDKGRPSGRTQKKTMPHPHSVYVSILYYFGLIGSLITTLLIGALLKRVFFDGNFYTFDQRVLIAPLIAGFTAIGFEGEEFFDHFSHEWNSFWIPISLAAAAIPNRAKRKRSG